MRLDGFRHQRPAFGKLATADLFIDESYQRPTRYAQVDNLADAWNWLLVGTVIASMRGNGRYALIDGQSRFLAARNIGIDALPALVCEGLTIEGEALLFAALQEERQNISAHDRFRAQLRGLFPRAVEINAALMARNLELSRRAGKDAPPDAIGAVAALEYLWQRGGQPLVEVVLDALIAGWPGMRGRFTAETLKGVGQFMQTDRPDMGRLIDALARIGGPADLAHKANLYRQAKQRYGMNAPGYVVKALREEYADSRQRAKRRKSSTAATGRSF